MKLATMMKLDLFDEMTESIDISNMKIKGPLDLDRFENLKIINCSNNQITQINGLSEKITHINISNNNISVFKNSFDNLKSIELDNNPFVVLFYQMDMLFPSNLTRVKKLKFGNAFNHPVDNLPSSLTHLIFGLYFNHSVDNLPNSITHLVFDYFFNQPINNFPDNLTHLSFNDSFNQSINNLPNKLTHLFCGDSFNQPIENLPNSIKYLNLGKNFIQRLDNLPNSIDTLVIKPLKLSSIEFVHLPKNLKKFNINIPFNYDYDYDSICNIDYNILPQNLIISCCSQTFKEIIKHIEPNVANQLELKFDIKYYFITGSCFNDRITKYEKMKMFENTKKKYLQEFSNYNIINFKVEEICP